MDNYDHTNRSSRPSILFAGYCLQKTPYLTVIYLCDKKSDYLLSLRHDPLNVGRGKIGVTNSITGYSLEMSSAGSISPAKSNARSRMNSVSPN